MLLPKAHALLFPRTAGAPKVSLSASCRLRIPLKGTRHATFDRHFLSVSSQLLELHDVRAAQKADLDGGKRRVAA